MDSSGGRSPASAVPKLRDPLCTIVALHDVFDALGFRDFLKSHHRGGEHGNALRLRLKLFLGHFGMAVLAGGESNGPRDGRSKNAENDDGGRFDPSSFQDSAGQETSLMLRDWQMRR